MVWNPSEYGNITEVLCPATDVWMPDIVMYFNEDTQDKVVAGVSK